MEGSFHFCADPESVIVTLDADDALIGNHVLERVRAEYSDGADATVGSMLRLDKEAAYIPNFESPRWWDSNVWQHLRTFRKRLFDAIDIKDMKIDGEWIDVATDWAFMVPIFEMAPRLGTYQNSCTCTNPPIPRMRIAGGQGTPLSPASWPSCPTESCGKAVPLTPCCWPLQEVLGPLPVFRIPGHRASDAFLNANLRNPAQKPLSASCVRPRQVRVSLVPL